MLPTKITRRPAWGMLPAFPIPNRLRGFFDDPFFRAIDEPITADLLPEAIGWNPMLDVSETDDEYVFMAELPGLRRADVTVTFEKDVLTIRGEKLREEKKEENGRKYHVFERAYGAFVRSFTLPIGVLADKIVAEMNDGVLTVRVPKAPEAKSAARQIEVKTK